MKQCMFFCLEKIHKKEKAFKNSVLRINNALRIYFIPFFLFLIYSSCISFDLNMLKDHSAEGVTFKAPPKPYKKIPQKGMDASWQDQAGGNILSFFSNCSSATPFTSLEEFQKDFLGDLKNFRVIYKNQTHHQNQKANYLKLKSLKPPDSKTSMELFLFKKEKCFYALVFLTTNPQKNISDQTPVFKNFLQEFRAP